MKKKFLIAILCAAVCSVCAFAACGTHEHSWDSGTVTTPATCGTAGEKTFTCTGCGETKTEAVPKTEHPHGEGWLFNDDEHWQPTTCEHTTERVSVGVHEWGTGVTVTTATCLNAGVVKYTCKCGKTKNETLPKTEHSYSEEWSSDGEKHWYACTTEGCTAVSEEHAHNWNGGVATTAATCAAEGVKTYTCTDCGKTKTEAIAKTDHPHGEAWLYNDSEHWQTPTCEHTTERASVGAHDMGSGEVVTAANCQRTGLKKSTCVCGKSQTEVIPKTDHSYSGEWKSDGDKHWRECTTEGCTEISYESAHNWDEGEITTPATCIAEGVKTFTCTDCGKTKTQSVAMIEHTASEEWSSDGEKHWHECTTEGCTEKLGEVEHSYGDWVIAGHYVRECSVCGYEKLAPSLTPGINAETSVGGGFTAGITLFSLNFGYYVVTCTTAVEVNCIYYDRLGERHEENYTLSSAEDYFYIQLADRSIAYIKAVSDSEEEIECTFSVECLDKAPAHTHSFSEEWSMDEVWHWHACTGNGCTEDVDAAEHEFGIDGVCTVCGYTN